MITKNQHRNCSKFLSIHGTAKCYFAISLHSSMDDAVVWLRQCM